MQLGMVGLGKMGFNMAESLRRAGHSVVGLDFSKETVEKLAATGSTGASPIEELMRKLESPRVIWLRVPSGDPVGETIAKLEPLIEMSAPVVTESLIRQLRSREEIKRYRPHVFGHAQRLWRARGQEVLT